LLSLLGKKARNLDTELKHFQLADGIRLLCYACPNHLPFPFLPEIITTGWLGDAGASGTLLTAIQGNANPNHGWRHCRHGVALKRPYGRFVRHGSPALLCLPGYGFG
jgi:hypothetical protein